MEDGEYDDVLVQDAADYLGIDVDDGDDDGDEDDSDSDDEDYEDEDYSAAEYVVRPPARARVSRAAAPVVIEDDSEPTKTAPFSGKCLEDVEGEWINKAESVDGSSCPICYEAWTSGGTHQVCCLPCGHIYGFSCINRWLQERGGSRKCPHCNRKCSLKDVRVLYATRICVVDDELQKNIQSLEAKCASLEKKNTDCRNRELQWQKREADLTLKVHQLTERTRYLEDLLDKRKMSSGSSTGVWGHQRPTSHGHNGDSESVIHGCSSSFSLQEEFHVEGARCFDVDASGQIILVARRLSGVGGMHALSKISMIVPGEREDIQIPAVTKVVRDIRVSPYSRLALLASLGKKLSVLSTESNNIILSYDLPAPAWSCAWDINSSHHIYAGLQNGMLLGFDMRKTGSPLHSVAGLTCNPVHTLHSISPDLALNSGCRTLLSASSVGFCEWNLGGVEERPSLIPGSENEGVCISLACSGGDAIVASFRPKVEMISVTQPFLSPSTNSVEHGVCGSHVMYKRMGGQSYQKLKSATAYVNKIRLPKSSIVDSRNHTIFASANEATGELALHDLSSLNVVESLKSRKPRIRDVRFTVVKNSELLGCLCEDTLQLFSA